MNNHIEHDGHSTHWEGNSIQCRPVNNYERAILLYRTEKLVDKVVMVQVTANTEVTTEGGK